MLSGAYQMKTKPVLKAGALVSLYLGLVQIVGGGHSGEISSVRTTIAFFECLNYYIFKVALHFYVALKTWSCLCKCLEHGIIIHFAFNCCILSFQNHNFCYTVGFTTWWEKRRSYSMEDLGMSSQGRLLSISGGVFFGTAYRQSQNLRPKQ